MKNKINLQLMYLFNIIFFTFGLSLTSYSSLLINKVSYISWLIPIITIPISILLFYFLPNNKNIIIKLKNNMIFKLVIVCYNLLSTIFLTYYTIKILTNWFYTNTNILIFIFFFSAIYLIGLIKINTIIRVGFIWSILFLFILITLIFIQNDLELSFIKPIIINNNILSCLFYLTLPLDNILYLLINTNTDNIPTKKNMTKGIIISLLIASLHLFLSLTIVNYRFYELLETPSINIFFMFYTKNYIGHYDIALIILLLITYFYKSSLYSNISLQFFDKKIKPLICFIFSILSFCILKILILNHNYVNKVKWILFGLILLVYLFIVFYRKENSIEKHN